MILSLKWNKYKLKSWDSVLYMSGRKCNKSTSTSVDKNMIISGEVEGAHVLATTHSTHCILQWKSHLCTKWHNQKRS